MDVVRRIESVPTNSMDKPLVQIAIKDCGTVIVVDSDEAEKKLKSEQKKRQIDEGDDEKERKVKKSEQLKAQTQQVKDSIDGVVRQILTKKEKGNTSEKNTTEKIASEKVETEKNNEEDKKSEKSNEGEKVSEENQIAEKKEKVDEKKKSAPAQRSSKLWKEIEDDGFL